MTRPNAAYDGDDPFVFVSYAHANSEEVYPEICWLQDQGFNLWYDEGIGGGSHWRDEIAQRIRPCSLFLFYATTNAFGSQVCRQELEYALAHDRTVLVLHIEGAEVPEGIDLAISNRQALFRYKLSGADYERKLFRTVADALGREDVSPNIPLRLRSRARAGLVRAMLGAALVFLLGAGTAAWLMRPEPPPVRPSEVAAVLFPHEFSRAGSTHLAINRAGTHIFALLSQKYPDRQVFVRPVDSFDVTPIAGTDIPRHLFGVFPSPNGSTLALAMRDGELLRLDATGGTPVPMAETASNAFHFHARWISESEIAVSDGGRAVKFSSRGDSEILGRSTTLNGPLQVLPERGVVLAAERDGELFRIISESYTSERRSVLVEGIDPRVTPRDQLLFLRNGKVWVARINEDLDRLLSEPVVALDAVSASATRAQYEFADTGTMVMQPEFEVQMGLLWVSRAGLEMQISLPGQPIMSIGLSPDESKVAFSSLNTLWVYDTSTGVASRVSQSDGQKLGIVWMADDQIVFSAFGFIGHELRVLDLASMQERAMVKSDRALKVHFVDAEGIVIYEDCRTYTVACDIRRMDLMTPGSAEDVIVTEFNERFPSLSPDGRYLAYSTDQFGPRRVVVRPYPDVEGGLWQVGVDGCDQPDWDDAGRILFVRCGSGSYSVAVANSPFALGDPELMFRNGPEYFTTLYSGTRDRFLMAKQTNINNVAIVVFNWFDALDRLIGASGTDR